jgi:hypothetical protein
LHKPKKPTELHYAVHPRAHFDHRLVVGICFILHDGRIHPYSTRYCHRFDTGTINSGKKSLEKPQPSNHNKKL